MGSTPRLAGGNEGVATGVSPKRPGFPGAVSPGIRETTAGRSSRAAEPNADGSFRIRLKDGGTATVRYDASAGVFRGQDDKREYWHDANGRWRTAERPLDREATVLIARALGLHAGTPSHG